MSPANLKNIATTVLNSMTADQAAIAIQKRLGITSDQARLLVTIVRTVLEDLKVDGIVDWNAYFQPDDAALLQQITANTFKAIIKNFTGCFK